VAATAFAPAAAPSISAGLALPDGVPDRGAVLSEPIARGALVMSDAAVSQPSVKVVDGDASDWIGEATRVGGSSRFDAGELIYSDFLFDAHGADDGADAARLAQFAELFYVESRASRLDQLLRTSGSQLGVPEPLGAPDEYGDVSGGLDVADLSELRLASDGEDLQLLVSVTNLADASKLGVLLLADTGEGDGGISGIGSDVLGSGLDVGRFESAFLAVDGTVRSNLSVAVVLEPGVEPEPWATTATGVAGYENHLEMQIDLGLVTDQTGQLLDLAIVTGRTEDDGSFTPLNVAFRGAEPIEIYSDRLQAFALADGTVDGFSSGAVTVNDLVAGRTQSWTFGPGYYERQMDSRAEMSREGGRDGTTQPYGIYVPSSWEAGEVTPATYWTHYRGGKAHSGTVINPRLTTQLGEERGNLMFFPFGRGTSEWYVTESHQDVFEVIADAEALFNVDATRRYISGYSMGGYATWLFTSLYPDMWAAGFAQSGAVTQGLWVGTGAEGDPFDPAFDQGWQEANGGDARAQLTYRALENLRHVPIAIDHGTSDELAAIPQVERHAQKLTELGYAHRMTRFLGYEHFTQAIVDEWADGAAYLDRFTLDPNPRDVTYAVVPALVYAVNTVDPAQGATFSFNPDGAYWVDDIVVAERGQRTPGDDTDLRPALDAKGTVQATAHGIAAAGVIMAPDVGAFSPLDHSTPFLRTGLQAVEDLTGLTAPSVRNALTLGLTNVSSVSIDVDRAALQAGESMVLAFTTDGDTVVRLVGAAARGGAFLLLDAEVDGDDLLVTLDAGSHSFTLDPTG
ncbi:MAG: hypothetical protein ACJA2H_001135, partial [Nitriliruptoraceae bacterium]